MPAIGDEEDSPPMQPPATRPDASDAPFPPPPGVPESLIPRNSTATTEPAPDAIVEAILARLEPSIANIHTRLGELFKLHEHAGLKLHAIDNGVGSAHTRIGLLEDEVRKLASVHANIANAVLALSHEQVELRTAIGDQSNFDKARLATAELHADGNEQRIERLEERHGEYEERFEQLEAASK
jgi:hypothetical protein